MKDIEKAIETMKYNKHLLGLPEQGTKWRANANTMACDLAIEALEKQLEPVQNNKFNYWRNICEIQAEQTAKSIAKYGYPLEQNTWLDISERLRYLQEELVDALMYIEHIKTLLGGENEN